MKSPAPTRWTAFLKAGVLDWLLEEDNPSVRYYALMRLLERSAKARDDRPDELASASIVHRRG
jgi:hypothetical protein